MLPGAVRPRTLPTRGRLTTARTAADVVVDPAKQIRAPVTGRVKRAGTYVLYCKYSDDYVVIEPDSHPGWEVKLLHVDHEIVNVGDRVTAGETIVAPRATKLPFASDVDEFTATPHWPHVHVEVVDPRSRTVRRRAAAASCPVSGAHRAGSSSTFSVVSFSVSNSR